MAEYFCLNLTIGNIEKNELIVNDYKTVNCKTVKMYSDFLNEYYLKVS